MTHRSPLFTLAAVVIFFAALLTADYVVHPAAQTAAPAAATTAPPSAGASAEPQAQTPAPAPTPAGSTPARPTAQKPADDEQSFPAKAVYVGRTEDRDLTVAVAVRGDRAAAYICDGDSREAWLRGSVDGDSVTLTSTSGYRITAQLDDDGRLKGTIRYDDRRWEFEARLAEPPAGIYRAKGTRTTIGWIRLPDGSLVGVATDSDGTSSPAPELGADDNATVDGQTVEAAPVDGDSEI